jgi:hypothetical protein
MNLSLLRASYSSPEDFDAAVGAHGGPGGAIRWSSFRAPKKKLSRGIDFRRLQFKLSFASYSSTGILFTICRPFPRFDCLLQVVAHL